MNKFAIITDSCADLNAELRKKYDIDYVNMRCVFDDGKDVPASLDWEFMPYHEFYDYMRKGNFVKTAQVPASEYEEKFSEYLEKGYDVLSLSCSSALSASVQASYAVKEKLETKYVGRKVFCVDTLDACMGLGLIAVYASTLRAEGKTVEETYELVESNKLKMNQFATVDSLVYLKRAGRVKAASAFFGGIFQVKPIIISDARGQNFAVEKTKGRKASISRIIELFKDAYEPEFPFKAIAVSHADDVETAEYIKGELKKLIADDVEIMTSVIGPIVGASVGPGTVSIYCFGKEVTVNKE